MALRTHQNRKEAMTVRELIRDLQNVENKDLPVFVEQKSNKTQKTEGIYLVFTPVETEQLPRDCVIVK